MLVMYQALFARMYSHGSRADQTDALSVLLVRDRLLNLVQVGDRVQLPVP